MKNKFYMLLSFLCSATLTFAQVKGKVYSTVQCFPGGNLRVHSNPMTLAAHIITPRSNHASSSVLFTDGAYTDETTDAGYVNGYVTKIGSEAFTFPVGSQEGNDLRSLTISMEKPSSIKLAVAYWEGSPGKELDPTGGAHDINSMSEEGVTGVTKLTSVSDSGFWDWVPLTDSDQESEIRIEVSIADHSKIEGYAPANIRLVGWNTKAEAWVNLSGDVAPATNTEGAIVTGTLTTSTMSEYSAITVGSVSGSPMPVTLISFTAKEEAGQVGLNWGTSEETNADYFQIERSSDAVNWKVIGRENAVGESKALLTYFFSDVAPLPRVNYYRLKMVDNDETFAYSKIQSVQIGAADNFLTLYPNPVSDVLHFKDVEFQKMQQVAIHNVAGKQVYQSENVSSGKIDVTKFNNGIYLVTVLMKNGHSKTEKVVINH
ncbi:hypothetical protein DYBT9623_00508 [Dyadobacter sp. CECT 9623]|uniref:Secretion system C-terminal sorting domain-containing protein n=1 Tax=Dyadobacter linearis TaxID=2823330 RepID=A0ABM8UKJ2_9BACT|nr:T9SS type A sorting domain-containing protein [Dyadobacter sp. CECT 9623]CAG5067781.1 hypothetical protein DYBT9623_00508 [Dyadobacter sp. CECT 9623]